MPTAAELAVQNAQLSSAHSEAKAALEKTVANHCPFGCQGTDLDDFGYCHHLVGFTNDRKSYEPVASLYRAFADGTPYDTGWKTVGGSAPVEQGDVFVNPQRVQKDDNGLSHLTSLWVSDRVYRKGDKPAQKPAIQAKPNDLFSLQARKRELLKKLEEKKLREEIAKLEKEVGEPDQALRNEVADLEEQLAAPAPKCDECGLEFHNAEGLATHKRFKHPPSA